MDDGELLKTYARGDEGSFAELVRRHIDLVHSAALRQVEGDSAAAADVTQSVFLDLAAKAAKLQTHTSITGWLYTSVRYLAANVRRAETRRRARELHAHAMIDLSHSPEPTWADLRPLIDEAMHDLAADERDAILLRIFESKPLAEVGRVLGVTENAARMRVERALEKLRAALQKRGVTATALGVMALLTANSVAAAPAGLAHRVLSAPRRAAPATGILGLLLAHKLKVAMGIAALALALPFILPDRDGSAGRDASDAAQIETQARTAASNSPDAATETTPSAPAASDTSADAAAAPEGPHLALTIVDAASGAPIPNVPIDQRTWAEGGFKSTKLSANRLGVARVPLTNGITELEITTRVDDFVDTRLKWSPKRGDTIPAEYTLRVIRPVKIGGRVIDADGQPVQGAEVGFNNRPDPLSEATVESYNFGWVTAQTDSDGRWQINRIAPQTLTQIYGSARHPDHVPSPMVQLEDNRAAEQQLREGTHVFQLGRGYSVAGNVVDESGRPIAGAKILVGRYGMVGSRNGESDSAGRFLVHGCAPGKTFLSAEAESYAATTLNIEVVENGAPHTVVLKPGRVLNIRVVNREGAGIPDVNCWLDTINTDPTSGAAHVQSAPRLKSNAQGKIQWANAPDLEMNFDFAGPGYMRKSDVRLRPAIDELVVVMDPALRVSGTVLDAETGQPISDFRLVAGWPPGDFPGSRPQWSTIDRFTKRFVGGKFDHSYEEPVVGGTANRGYVFKFEADDYAPHITDTIAPDAGHVTFNIRLKKSEAINIQVVDTDNTVRAGIDVALLSPHAGIQLLEGGLGSAQVGGASRSTDAEGRIRFAEGDDVTHIVAATKKGFALAPVEQLKQNPRLQLQPWASVEGVLLQAGKPLPDRDLQVTVKDPSGIGSIRSHFNHFNARTDAEGRFKLAVIPPGANQLLLKVAMDFGEGRKGFSSSSIHEFEAEPGQTAQLKVEFGEHMLPPHRRSIPRAAAAPPAQ